MDGAFLKCGIFVFLQMISFGLGGQVSHGKVPVKAVAYSRIIGGTATTISQVPYLVNLRLDGSFICGGALIKSNFVLTAAHCVKGVTASRIKVQGGTGLLSNSGVMRNALRIFVPSTYNSNTMVWDVAVIKLASAMTGTNIATIPLCTQSLYINQQVRISGWGLTSEGASTVPNQVRTAIIKMTSKSNCINKYSGQVNIGKTMICASVPGVKDSCSGDSGGPLVVKGQVCGIVSFGIGCGRSAYPGVYTSVNVVKKYINNCLAQ